MEEKLLDLLARGWRVSVKTHLVPKYWLDLEPGRQDEYPFRDSDGDAIGWVAMAFAYGPKRERLNLDDVWRSSGVMPTPSAALANVEQWTAQVDAKEVV